MISSTDFFSKASSSNHNATAGAGNGSVPKLTVLQLLVDVVVLVVDDVVDDVGDLELADFATYGDSKRA